MWDEIVNEAENVIKEDLEAWFNKEMSNVLVYGGKWKDMLDEDIMMVSREQRFVVDRLPFVITKVDLVGDGIIGFEGNGKGIDIWTNVKTDILPVTMDFSDGGLKELVFSDMFGVTYKYVVSSGMFNIANAVSGNDLVSVLRDQSRGRVVINYDEVKRRIEFKFVGVSKVNIIKDDIFGMSGEVIGNNKVRNMINVKATVGLTVGCQSVATRSELKNVLYHYYNDKRNLEGNGVIGSSDKVEVRMMSMIRGAGDSDVPIGGGDMLKMLYLGGYSMDVLISAVDSGEDYVFNGLKTVQIEGIAHDC